MFSSFKFFILKEYYKFKARRAKLEEEINKYWDLATEAHKNLIKVGSLD
jgi:hypothetical protein